MYQERERARFDALLDGKASRFEDGGPSQFPCLASSVCFGTRVVTAFFYYADATRLTAAVDRVGRLTDYYPSTSEPVESAPVSTESDSSVQSG